MTDSPDYTYDITEIKKFLTKTKVNEDKNNLESLSFFEKLKACLSHKYEYIKETITKFKKPIQQILTLTDVGTDIRTCYIMYNINPYWYTIMLSAIVTPFIVFWASSYNFQFVVKLRHHADNDTRLANKLLSGWITALSLPIIGIILTAIEILGLYLLALIEPLIPMLRLNNFEIFEFWGWCLYEFKNSSREFFQICELFFESIPQVILQLWIYMFHSDSFTDSSGEPLLTTFDISLSLGAAILNIIINGYEIKNKARAWGLSLDSYIPFFMGSQLDIVKDSCIPVKNWLNTDRFCCDLSHIERFFASKMIKQSNREINNYLLKCNKQEKKVNPKKIVIPLKTNELINNIYEVDIKRTDLILFLRTLRKAQDEEIIAIDINEFGHTNNKTSEQIFLINKVIISENRLDLNFLKQSYVCDYSGWFNLSFINRFTNCQYKNRYKVPLIEKFIESLSVKNKLSSKLFIIGWARKYINFIECTESCPDEAIILDELHEASKIIWSGIKKIRNIPKIPKVPEIKDDHSYCNKLLCFKNSSTKDINKAYVNRVYDQIEDWSISKPLFYNYIQYISVIAMLFNPEYFYLYQSKTTQFYIILTIYGDKRIINNIYDSIEYLLSDNCKSNQYLFTHYSFSKWKKLIYMNNELLYKVTQYLSLIIERKTSFLRINEINMDSEFNYITKIILHSLIKTIDINTYSNYHLYEYEDEPKKISVKDRQYHPPGTGRIREMIIEAFPLEQERSAHLICGSEIILQTEFDVEHRYYYIINHQLKSNYNKSKLYNSSELYLAIDMTNKNRLNVPILTYTPQRTNSTKFIFVKKEQSEIHPSKYEDPKSNYNEYYILTQCRKYFLNFSIKNEDKLSNVNTHSIKEPSENDISNKEYYAEPYLISRKGFIGKSTDHCVVRIIDSHPKIFPPFDRKPEDKTQTPDLKEDIINNNVETKVNIEDDSKESIKIDIKNND